MMRGEFSEVRKSSYRVNTTLRGHSVSSAGVQIWNSLKTETALSATLKVFKREIVRDMIKDYQT